MGDSQDICLPELYARANICQGQSVSGQILKNIELMSKKLKKIGHRGSIFPYMENASAKNKKAHVN